MNSNQQTLWLKEKASSLDGSKTGRWLVLTAMSGWLVDQLEIQDRLQDCAEDARGAV